MTPPREASAPVGTPLARAATEAATKAASETARLDRVAGWYDPHTDFDRHACVYGASLIRRHAIRGNCLEVACGTGVQTVELLEAFADIDAFDGSVQNVDRTLAAVMAAAGEESGIGGGRGVGGEAGAPSPAFDLAHALAEEFDPGEKRYDNIVMTHFLEHVVSPIRLLRRFAGFLTERGALHVTVPNAGSLHREIGVAMGILPRATALSDRDKKIGHRRVYTPALLRRHVRAAGLKTDVVEGILLKPLSNAQMEKLDRRLVAALFAVGRERPELCAEIYVRCRAR